jgi:hypothetical protein
MAEEMAHRALMSFQWEEQLGDFRKAREDQQRVLEGGAKAALRDWGYVEVHGPAGDSYWIRPGTQPLTYSLRPEVKALITDVVKQTLAEAKEPSQ